MHMNGKLLLLSRFVLDLGMIVIYYILRVSMIKVIVNDAFWELKSIEFFMQHRNIQGDVEFYSSVQSGKHRWHRSRSCHLSITEHSSETQWTFYCTFCYVTPVELFSGIFPVWFSGINNLTRRRLIKIWSVNNVFQQMSSKALTSCHILWFQIPWNSSIMTYEFI